MFKEEKNYLPIHAEKTFSIIYNTVKTKFLANEEREDNFIKKKEKSVIQYLQMHHI